MRVERLVGPIPGQETRKKVPLKSILEQNKVTYLFETSIGDIVLKYPGAMAIEEATLSILARTPELSKAMDESQLYFEMAESGIQYSPEQMRRAEELGLMLKPISDAITALCFVEPEVKGSELSGLFDALEAGERVKLRSMLQTLTQPLSRAEVDAEMVRLLRSYNIPLFKDASALDLTKQQKDLLVTVANQEAEQLDALRQ